jgi:hypothetical protein
MPDRRREALRRASRRRKPQQRSRAPLRAERAPHRCGEDFVALRRIGAAGEAPARCMQPLVYGRSETRAPESDLEYGGSQGWPCGQQSRPKRVVRRRRDPRDEATRTNGARDRPRGRSLAARRIDQGRGVSRGWGDRIACAGECQSAPGWPTLRTHEVAPLQVSSRERPAVPVFRGRNGPRPGIDARRTGRCTSRSTRGSSSTPGAECEG